MDDRRFEQVPTWWQQEEFRAFLGCYRDVERPLFFVGSGLSRWAGLPDWPTLLRQVAAAADPDARERAEALVGRASFASYQEAGSLLKAALTKKRWRETLGSILNDRKKIRERSTIHEALVGLKWHRIVTTNYDRLIEQASERLRIPFETFHYSSPGLPDSERLDKQVIIHLHGDVTDPECDLVLGKAEYDSLYLANDSRFYYARTVGGHLRHAGVILFLGYSYDDMYVADLVNREREGMTDQPMFALVPRKERQRDFEARLADQARRHRVRYISFSRADNYRELLQLLEYLRNPAEFDDLFAWRLSVRRPTVVFIRGGGTIGAKSQVDREGRSLDIDQVPSRFDEGLEDLATAVLGRYRRDFSLPLEIVWEILPPEQQLLSENATVEDWNNVLRKLQSCFMKYFAAPERVGSTARIHDPDLHALFLDECDQYERADRAGQLTDRMFMDGFRNRYVLGFVLLYGTDTLAFLAPALAFGLRHIPCSVLITGANQPLFSRNVAGDEDLDQTSDGWRNLANSLLFLQSFGHRLTEYFVVFGDTIHHAVNLRKRDVAIIPYDREQFRQPNLEPFMYRNLSLTGQYMFRLIDGVFSNNFYGATTRRYHSYLRTNDPRYNDLWHVRPNPFRDYRAVLESAECFSRRVKYVELTPSFPRIDVEAMLRDEDEVQVVLVEGYNSGTYSTAGAHEFATFLYDLDRHGVPVVLISRYGIRATQDEYKVTEIHGRRIRVLRLYGIVLETALPLLSLVVGRIAPEAWTPAADDGGVTNHLAEHRRGLLQRELVHFFDTRKDILTEELKYSIDRPERFRRLTELRDIEEKHRLARERSDPEHWEAGRKVAARWTPERAKTLAVLPRAALLDVFEDTVEQFERVGARPDGFLTLDAQGFSLGSLLATSCRDRGHHDGYKWSRYWERDEDEREGLRMAADELLREVAAQLAVSWAATVNVPSFDVMVDPRSRRTCFTFRVIVDRGSPANRSDDRYSATSMSDAEADLLVSMFNGCRPEQGEEDFAREMATLYEKAQQRTWSLVTDNIDWFVLGFFKGVCCVLAALLGFDQEGDAPHMISSVSRQQAIRQSIQCQVLGLHTKAFELQFRCFDRADAGLPHTEPRRPGARGGPPPS